jgi:DNA-binding response OmpR family regulator
MATTTLLHARVVVVDDDRMIREMLELGLSREGYDVQSAADGIAALELVRRFDPEVIVLDIMMPKIDGISLLPKLREISQAPIVMLTAKGGTEDKVQSLTAGADDYLVKPFVFEELIARLQAKLRRPQLIEENVLRWRDLALNPQTRELMRGKDGVELTQREFDLLSVFMREPRRVFSKDHLLEIVWGHDFEGGPNIVETYISYLRAKIDRPGERGSFIRTVRGVGYGLAQHS